MRMTVIWSKTDPARSMRRQARQFLRMADGSGDGAIADELRTLANRYVDRAVELERAPTAIACNDNLPRRRGSSAQPRL